MKKCKEEKRNNCMGCPLLETCEVKSGEPRFPNTIYDTQEIKYCKEKYNLKKLQ